MPFVDADGHPQRRAGDVARPDGRARRWPRRTTTSATMPLPTAGRLVERDRPAGPAAAGRVLGRPGRRRASPAPVPARGGAAVVDAAVGAGSSPRSPASPTPGVVDHSASATHGQPRRRRRRGTGGRRDGHQPAAPAVASGGRPASSGQPRHLAEPLDRGEGQEARRREEQDGVRREEQRRARRRARRRRPAGRSRWAATSSDRATPARCARGLRPGSPRRAGPAGPRSASWRRTVTRVDDAVAQRHSSSGPARRPRSGRAPMSTARCRLERLRRRRPCGRATPRPASRRRAAGPAARRRRRRRSPRTRQRGDREARCPTTARHERSTRCRCR